MIYVTLVFGYGGTKFKRNLYCLQVHRKAFPMRKTGDWIGSVYVLMTHLFGRELEHKQKFFSVFH